MIAISLKFKFCLNYLDTYDSLFHLHLLTQLKSFLNLKRFLSAFSRSEKTKVPDILPLYLVFAEYPNLSGPSCSHGYYEGVRDYMTFKFTLSCKIYHSIFFFPKRNSEQTIKNFNTKYGKVYWYSLPVFLHLEYL